MRNAVEGGRAFFITACLVNSSTSRSRSDGEVLLHISKHQMCSHCWCRWKYVKRQWTSARQGMSRRLNATSRVIGKSCFPGSLSQPAHDIPVVLFATPVLLMNGRDRRFAAPIR